MMKKLCGFLKKTPQDVRRNMHNEFWASLPWLCCQEYEKLSRTPKLLKIQFFEKIYFFHQKWFFNNGEGNFDNGSKLISLRIHRFSAQIPKTTKKKFQLVERKIPFLKMFLCTRIMQLWQPCRNFLVKTLKTFCCNSRNYENLTSSPKNLLVKMFVWTCIRKLRSLDKPAVSMPPKLRKIFFSQSPKRIAMQFFRKK